MMNQLVTLLDKEHREPLQPGIITGIKNDSVTVIFIPGTASRPHRNLVGTDLDRYIVIKH